MSNSSLVSVTVPAHQNNCTVGRSGKNIEIITLHRVAGVLSAEKCGKLFQDETRNSSSHYGIGKDGEIGLYIDVFFKGHASKMLGLKNNFTHIYEKFMKKFTVTKPQYDDEEDSEDIFNRVFGSLDDEE